MRRLVLFALLVVAGCKHPGPRVYVQPHYAEGADGLRAMWRDILEAAKKDDRDRVHDLLATTLLSDAEVKRLLGPAKGDALLPRYHMLMGNLINRGAVELVANVYEHKYDAVDAFAADDPALATALVEPHPLFAARVRKSAEDRGLRYDGFFTLDGTWKTFNMLGKFVDVVPPPPSGATTK